MSAALRVSDLSAVLGTGRRVSGARGRVRPHPQDRNRFVKRLEALRQAGKISYGGGAALARRSACAKPAPFNRISALMRQDISRSTIE